MREATIVSQQLAQGNIKAITADEQKVLDELHGKPQQLQEWIDSEVTYTRDHEQFRGSLCPSNANSDNCDVWAPAAHILRTHREDCDGVLAISHYLNDNKGIGLYLERKKTKDVDPDRAHAVYIYPQNGMYGIISINEVEYKPAIFKSPVDAALSFNAEYDLFQFITIPNESSVLLYSTNGIKDECKVGSAYHMKSNSPVPVKELDEIHP